LVKEADASLTAIRDVPSSVVVNEINRDLELLSREREQQRLNVVV
jgi:hypothetical protein